MQIQRPRIRLRNTGASIRFIQLQIIGLGLQSAEGAETGGRKSPTSRSITLTLAESTILRGRSARNWNCFSPRMHHRGHGSVLHVVPLSILRCARISKTLPLWTASLHLKPSRAPLRSEEHTSELPSLMRISYADFCLKK